MDAPATRLTPRGEWNHVIGFIGVPQTGKSTKALAVALEMARQPAFIVAMDPNDEFPSELPDELVKEHALKPYVVHRHESASDARAALAVDGRGVHAVSTVELLPVLDLAKGVARTSLDLHPRLGDHRQQGVPVILLVDEVVNCEAVQPERIHKSVRDLLGRRRKHHVALLYTSQSVDMCHKLLLRLAPTLYLFRVDHPEDLKALEKRGGVPPEICARVSRLPDHECIIYRRGTEIRDEKDSRRVMRKGAGAA